MLEKIFVGIVVAALFIVMAIAGILYYVPALICAGLGFTKAAKYCGRRFMEVCVGFMRLIFKSADHEDELDAILDEKQILKYYENLR